MKKYIEYISEIENLRILCKLSAIQILALQICASVESNKINYDSLKKNFIKQNKSRQKTKHLKGRKP